MKKLWTWFLAWTRISNRAVCEMSRGRESWNDYHDYPDSEQGTPDHFSMVKCKRCGKEFNI